MMLEPLVATILAVAVFGETLNAGIVVGGLLMLSAVLAVRPREAGEEPAVPAVPS